MQELLEYRQKMIGRIEAAVQEFRRACEAVRDPYRPLEVGGWNAHQIAVHTRDTELLVYGLRARRTLEVQDPLFENFDGDAWMEQHYDPKEPLTSSLDQLSASVLDLAKRLRTLAPEDWARHSRHETLGEGFTTQTWVERGLAHIEEHLATLRKADGQDPSPTSR